jgi:multiple sugar transport system permease protein
MEQRSKRAYNDQRAFHAGPDSLLLLNSIRYRPCEIQKSRHRLFVVLATLMIPRQVTLISTHLIFRELGWGHTHAPLILPSWFGGAFGIFLLRQFFLTIPDELTDAAKVDGGNPFRIDWQLFMALTGPIIATLAIFTFLDSWNDLLGPLINLRYLDLMTFSVTPASFTRHNVM